MWLIGGKLIYCCVLKSLTILLLIKFHIYIYIEATYSPLRTESPTNHTPTPTVDAMDTAITAQTNFIDGVELEGDFFSYCDNLTVLMKEMIYVID